VGGSARICSLDAMGCLVLCYHAVSETWDDPLAISTQILERQLKLLLARGYTPADADGALPTGRERCTSKSSRTHTCQNSARTSCARSSAVSRDRIEAQLGSVPLPRLSARTSRRAHSSRHACCRSHSGVRPRSAAAAPRSARQPHRCTASPCGTRSSDALPHSDEREVASMELAKLRRRRRRQNAATTASAGEPVRTT
jgi:hypothetical protein